jgi:hypothetical protein
MIPSMRIEEMELEETGMAEDTDLTQRHGDAEPRKDFVYNPTSVSLRLCVTSVSSVLSASFFSASS